MSRYHLAIEALRRAPRMQERAPALVQECRAMLEKHHAYIRAHFEDLPEIRDWVWADG